MNSIHFLFYTGMVESAPRGWHTCSRRYCTGNIVQYVSQSSHLILHCLIIKELAEIFPEYVTVVPQYNIPEYNFTIKVLIVCFSCFDSSLFLSLVAATILQDFHQVDKTSLLMDLIAAIQVGLFYIAVIFIANCFSLPMKRPKRNVFRLTDTLTATLETFLSRRFHLQSYLMAKTLPSR